MQTTIDRTNGQSHIPIHTKSDANMAGEDEKEITNIQSKSKSEDSCI